MSDLIALRAIIRGRVQGVYFRAFTTRQAKELALTGYARNLANGSVEVIAEGDKERLQKLVNALQIGPPGATVAEVKITWSDYTGDYPDFSIRY